MIGSSNVFDIDWEADNLTWNFDITGDSNNINTLQNDASDSSLNFTLEGDSVDVDINQLTGTYFYRCFWLFIIHKYDYFRCDI